MNNIYRLSTALLAVLSMTGCGFDGGPIIKEDASENTFQFGGALDDAELLSLNVKQALKKNAQTMHAGIQVSTKNDTVKLSGYVDNDAVAAEAERIAYQVPGVRFVVNALYIR